MHRSKTRPDLKVIHLIMCSRFLVFLFEIVHLEDPLASREFIANKVMARLVTNLSQFLFGLPLYVCVQMLINLQSHHLTQMQRERCAIHGEG